MKQSWQKIFVAAFMIGIVGMGVFQTARLPTASAQEAAKRLKIGVSVPAADHGWTAGVGWWAKRAMSLHPEIDWVYQTAPNPEKQNAR